MDKYTIIDSNGSVTDVDNETFAHPHSVHFDANGNSHTDDSGQEPDASDRDRNATAAGKRGKRARTKRNDRYANPDPNA